MHWLVFDITNMLHRTFFSNHGTEDEQTIAGMASHMALTTLYKYFKMVKPDRVVLAMDRSSWRKVYTASEDCVSKKPYKGNRRQDLTPAQAEKYARFINHLREFEKLITDHTSIITMQGEGLEADDLMGGFCQLTNPETDEVTVITTDSDMSQLLKHKHVRVISPATDKDHNLSEYNDDAEFYLFVKCIRGDSTDNIQSAFPRVRMDRLRKAYTDPYEMVKLMEETWTNQNGTVMNVKDLYNENRLLIDLEKQPEDIRDRIDQTILTALQANKEFSMFYFLRFVGKYKLVRIQESIDNYLPMLCRNKQ